MEDESNEQMPEDSLLNLKWGGGSRKIEEQDDIRVMLVVSFLYRDKTRGEIFIVQWNFDE